MTEINPKVFISYCQESIEFSDKVLNFSNKLRNEGIDTILDQYVESPKEGWPRWMENAIEEANFIILICTQEYLNRVMGRTDNGVGKGVKWESNIIYQHLYNNDSLNERFIPVVFKQADVSSIPMPLQGATYYDISNTKRYDDLYWRLRGYSRKEKPQLGKLRPLPIKERKSLFVTSPIDLESWDKAIWRGAAFMLDPTNENPPMFILPFKNEKYATKIFKDWIAIYSNVDKNEELRIAIIEGDIPGEERGYSIHISANMDGVIKRMEETGMKLDESLIMSISRIHRANPTDNFKMFNLFKAQYRRHHQYVLLPAVLDEQLKRIKPLMDYGIVKRELIFKNVTDIDKNDLDFPVISKNKPWKEYKEF